MSHMHLNCTGDRRNDFLLEEMLFLSFERSEPLIVDVACKTKLRVSICFGTDGMDDIAEGLFLYPDPSPSQRHTGSQEKLLHQQDRSQQADQTVPEV